MSNLKTYTITVIPKGTSLKECSIKIKSSKRPTVYESYEGYKQVLTVEDGMVASLTGDGAILIS